MPTYNCNPQMSPSIPTEKVFWVETFKNWLLTTMQVFSSWIVTKV